ncbi:MAG: ABC transporter permease [Aminipila sp.]
MFRGLNKINNWLDRKVDFISLLMARKAKKIARTSEGMRLNIFSDIYRWYKRCANTIIPIMFVLIIPTVAGIIIGAEFSGHTVTNVPTAIVDMDNSQLSRDLVENFRTNNVFNVNNYLENIEELESQITVGEVAVGVIIPENFSSDLTKGKAPKVMVLYDGAQMSMTGAAKGKIAETISTIKSGYMMKVMMGSLGISQDQAMKYIQPIQCTTRTLGNPERSSLVFMLQGLLINFCQVAVYILGIELVRKNERTLKNLIKHGAFAGFIGTISVVLMICTQILFFSAPFRGSFLAALILTVLYMTGIGIMGVSAMVKSDDRLEAVKSCSGVMAMFMLCGYTFPVLGMPTFLQVIAKFLPFTYYVSPMRDISLLGSTLSMMTTNIICLCIFVMITIVMLHNNLKKSKKIRVEKHQKSRLEHRIIETELRAGRGEGVGPVAMQTKGDSI